MLATHNSPPLLVRIKSMKYTNVHNYYLLFYNYIKLLLVGIECPETESQKK